MLNQISKAQFLLDTKSGQGKQNYAWTRFKTKQNYNTWELKDFNLKLKWICYLWQHYQTKVEPVKRRTESIYNQTKPKKNKQK